MAKYWTWNRDRNNTAIDIYVSTGPKEEPEPEPDKEIPFKISLTPASENEEVEIRVERIQDESRETVYNKVHKINGKTIEIPVKGKVGSIFEIYYDGIYIDEIVHPGS